MFIQKLITITIRGRGSFVQLTQRMDQGVVVFEVDVELMLNCGPANQVWLCLKLKLS